MHGEQPTDLNLLRHFAKLDLHAFPIAQLHAEALALRNVGLRDFHAAFRLAKPAHAMGQPRGPEPDLRDLQSVTFAQKDVFGRDFQSIEFELAVATVLMRPHDRNAAYDSPAGLVLVKQERRQTPTSIVTGARNKDEMRGALRARREPLASLDDVALPFFLRVRSNHRRIGATTRRRLGH